MHSTHRARHRLEYLNLARNQLFGRLPDSLGSLVNLRWLSLHGDASRPASPPPPPPPRMLCAASCALPTWSCAVRQFGVGMTVPHGIRRCKAREDDAGVGVHLRSADNEFTGTLHPSFGQLNKCEQTVLPSAGRRCVGSDCCTHTLEYPLLQLPGNFRRFHAHQRRAFVRSAHLGSGCGMKRSLQQRTRDVT